jgi:hypothetical protein
MQAISALQHLRGHGGTSVRLQRVIAGGEADTASRDQRGSLQGVATTTAGAAIKLHAEGLSKTYGDT